METANGVSAHKTKAEEQRSLRNRKKKEHKKEVKRQQREVGASAANNADTSGGEEAAPAAEGDKSAPMIEYISRREEAVEDPAFRDLAKIFEHFSTAEELLGTKPAAAEKGTGAVDAKQSGAEGGGEEGDDDLDGGKDGSKRKLKKDTRLSIAALKRTTDRPEVVEQWDVCAAEPKLLIYLKAYRHVVPVPRHWSQKRAYLQGKRGVEKKPFQLPDFIAATGIEKIRTAVVEKEEAKKLKAKQRETTRPKMNRIDLDYQVLHDAFFKHQTKPKLTLHGDVYWEGKEHEVHLREKRPGQLSLELRRALGMGDDPLTPPPWLVNVQRYGPPPSYRLLQIPGLNAPLPEGASYGTHPGGWGKPPVDELGQPLYGNPFAAPTPLSAVPGGSAGGPAAKPWGEPDSESEHEDDDEDEGGAAGGGGGGRAGAALSEDELSRGISSVSSIDTGIDTPAALQLRKDRPAGGTDTPVALAAGRLPERAPPDKLPEQSRTLYTVLEPQAASVGNATFGSAHTYAIPPPEQAPRAAGKGKAAGSVEVALDPSELEDLDEETLKRKYDAQVNAAKRANAKEDLSDLVDEHLSGKRRKADHKPKR